jgi:preprotein translocase subunit SecD
MMDIMKNWRIFFLLAIVAISLLMITTKGLTYGIDFTGGTELKLEIAGQPTSEEMDAMRNILADRLNSMGLKSTQVLKEADGRHITIKVATTDMSELSNVKRILDQQAVFEQYVDGQLAARGDEIQLDLSNQGGAVQTSGRSWRVYVRTTGDAPARTGEVMKGKAGSMTDIFLDRPRDAFILMESEICSELSNTQFSNHPDDSGYTHLSFIEDRANIPVVCYDRDASPGNDSLLDELGIVIEEQGQALDLTEAVAKMQALFDEGKTELIISNPLESLPAQLREKIDELNTTLTLREKLPGQEFHINYGSAERPDNTESWIDVVTGLKSTLRIGEGLTYGTPVYNSVFEGGSPTAEEAKATADRFRIWLSSGNLPARAEIVLEKPNLPELGQQFLQYAGLMALLALGIVAMIISLRYRHPKISLAILSTSFSEIVMILGFAALVSWELDLAAMAGIIAAIGTGVDHQIIITDEALRGERRKDDKKMWDVRQSVNRAFFIILASATTTICALLPLMSIIDLRGFAFTSIIGILIGVLISRPAYGRLAELIL